MHNYRWIVAAISFVFLTGFKGTLQVYNDLKFTPRKGLKELRVGLYNTSIDESRDGLDFHIEVSGPNNDPIFSFVTPESFDFPNYVGGFLLRTEQTGHAYDVSGNVFTKTVTSPVALEQEDCRETVREKECKRRSDGTEKCRYVEREISGKREVEVQETFVEKDLKMYWLLPGTAQVQAKFEGERNVLKERQYLYYGHCRY